MVNSIVTLLEGNPLVLSLLGGASLLMLLGSLLAIPVVIVKLPSDYLRREHKLVRGWPLYLSVPFLLIKNALGVLFFISGLAMLVLPGQGLLTIVIALVLLDFPRKRVLIRHILGKKRILRAINRLRKKYGKAELELPPGRPPNRN